MLTTKVCAVQLESYCEKIQVVGFPCNPSETHVKCTVHDLPGTDQ